MNEFKNDKGKTRVDLIEPEFIEGLGQVMEHGLKIYKKENSWKEVQGKKNRYYAAALRHLLNHRKGKEDADSNLSPLLHVAANCMFLYWLECKESKEGKEKEEKKEKNNKY